MFYSKSRFKRLCHERRNDDWTSWPTAGPEAADVEGPSVGTVQGQGGCDAAAILRRARTRFVAQPGTCRAIALCLALMHTCTLAHAHSTKTHTRTHVHALSVYLSLPPYPPSPPLTPSLLFSLSARCAQSLQTETVPRPCFSFSRLAPAPAVMEQPSQRHALGADARGALMARPEQNPRPRSLRRALLMPQVSTGALCRRSMSSFKRAVCGPRQEEEGA